jgi:1-phosphofructokinase
VGGADGDHLARLTDELGLHTLPVPISAPVRSNVSVVEPDGTVTKLNAPGPELTDTDVDALRKTVVAEVGDVDWIVASGSLPPGAPDDFYARLVTEVHAAGRRIAVDTSGDPLAAAIGAGPDVCKPNDEELAAIVGRPLSTFGEVVAAAQELRADGARAIVVSLGADGALLIDDTGTYHASSPPLVPLSNVGAGDATLSGFLAAGGEGPEALRTAVAWGAAAVRLPGSAMPEPDDIDVDEITVADVDHDRRLRD